MIDHIAFIRDNWHRRHTDELIRICIRRAIDMQKSFNKHGVWGHPPMGAS